MPRATFVAPPALTTGADAGRPVLFATLLEPTSRRTGRLWPLSRASTASMRGR